MSGRTISQLDLALPLTGDEWVPVVQNGVTRRLKLSDLLRAGFTGSDIRSLRVAIEEDGQSVFTMPGDVYEVEQVQINGQGLSPESFTYTAPTLTILNLPYLLETVDELLIVYSALPTATQT